MKSLLKLMNSFWFCLSMAVVNLLFIMQSLTDGSSPWISALGVVCWVYLAYRTTRPTHMDDLPLTDEQLEEIAKITKRFREELEAVVNEAVKDESNNGKDKETDTQGKGEDQ